MNVILEAKNIKKAFGKVLALDKVEIRAYAGKANILMGENGAGKSTIMNIISGNLAPDQGEIFFEGKKVTAQGIKEFQKMGVAIVHQEIKLVDTLTIAENIFLGREKTNKFGIINYSEINNLAQEIINQLDPKLDVRTKAEKLTIAEKQIVEIAKALSQKSKVIIFDEPTSSIGLKETIKFFEIIEKLKKEKIAILYITHRMEELEKIGDYITVYRDGKYIQEMSYLQTTNSEIIELMVGRKLESQFPLKNNTFEKIPILKIQNLNNKNVKNINFEINTHEILGFAGLVGAKRTELFKALLGYEPITSGSIYLNNKKIVFNSPSEAIKNHIYYISEDRKQEGLFLEKSISFNDSISAIDKISLAKGLFIYPNREQIVNENINNQLRVKRNSLNQLVKNLSGGNQQKVAISKALLSDPQIIIFDEPTRGVDVGARREIYEIIEQLKNSGKAVVVISSDLPEIIGIADRLIVMHEGKIEVDTKEKLNQKQIMNYALGLREGANE
ncbi:sugar ABC transporter ATP-binding protein [Candidatus Mycoplasma pogonae]